MGFLREENEKQVCDDEKLGGGDDDKEEDVGTGGSEEDEELRQGDISRGDWGGLEQIQSENEG